MPEVLTLRHQAHNSYDHSVIALRFASQRPLRGVLLYMNFRFGRCWLRPSLAAFGVGQASLTLYSRLHKLLPELAFYRSFILFPVGGGNYFALALIPLRGEQLNVTNDKACSATMIDSDFQRHRPFLVAARLSCVQVNFVVAIGSKTRLAGAIGAVEQFLEQFFSANFGTFR